MLNINVLITGGCGFIGSNFVRHWIQKIGLSGKVLNLDKLTYAGNPLNLQDIESNERYHFIEGDIRDGELVASLLREFQINAIINFAAESHVDRSIDSPQEFANTNVLGTLGLLHESRMYWQKELNSNKDFRFLHISTDEVYGTLELEDPAFTEETAFAPNSPYAASKAASDHFVRSYYHTYGLPVVTTNCSNNYGPYQFPEKLIPLTILNALSGQEIPIYGDGMQRRDWLYVEDHCKAIALALDKGRPGQTYNLGGRAEKSNIEVVDLLCELLDELRPREGGTSYSELKTYVQDRPGHDRRYAIDFSKIESELGWGPKEGFNSGLRRTVEWYLEHVEWIKDTKVNKYQKR